MVGATNEVPEDEVGAAFYDRFLVRCQLEPVSAAGFAELLHLTFHFVWGAVEEQLGEYTRRPALRRDHDAAAVVGEAR